MTSALRPGMGCVFHLDMHMARLFHLAAQTSLAHSPSPSSTCIACTSTQSACSLSCALNRPPEPPLMIVCNACGIAVNQHGASCSKCAGKGVGTLRRATSRYEVLT